MKQLSSNTKAILLLTAPLIAGRGEASTDLLTLGEYKRLARVLREKQLHPADLLSPQVEEILAICSSIVDPSRLKSLLTRGLLLSHAVERWQTRAIWVLSRADAEFPKRIKLRLKEDSPPILYGCGDMGILDTGGLAIVGSRNADDALIRYTENIGYLAAKAGKTVVSGGARGIDQAAMRGALESGGKVAGVLADSLERTVMQREHRNLILDGRLVVISPYDPSAGFNVGNAMQRNKLIYGFADAALVVNAEWKKGGTWTGAVEQLEKLKFIQVYVRSNGEIGKGLEELQNKGAVPWPNPKNVDEFLQTFDAKPHSEKEIIQKDTLDFSISKINSESNELTEAVELPKKKLLPIGDAHSNIADDLFSKVQELLQRSHDSKTDAEVAAELNVSKIQARDCLRHLANQGILKKLSKPVRFRLVEKEHAHLFK